MLHIGLQVKNGEQLKQLEKALKQIDILDMKEFEKDKAGIYFMSVEPIESKTIDDFTNDELIQECKDRNIDVW